MKTTHSQTRYMATVLSLALLLANGGLRAAEEPPVLPIQRLTMETVLKIAEAAVAQCRKEGMNIAVTVVDRGGNAQIVLRDTLAMDLTLVISKQKAYTAMSFNSPTSQLENRFKTPFSVGKVEGLVMSAGGLPITAGGTILGGIGVSGSPSGETDERCAKAGLDAIRTELEMAL